MEEKTNCISFHLPKELFEQTKNLQVEDACGVIMPTTPKRYLDCSIGVDSSELELFLPLIKNIFLFDKTTKTIILSAEVKDDLEEELK